LCIVRGGVGKEAIDEERFIGLRIGDGIDDADCFDETGTMGPPMAAAVAERVVGILLGSAVCVWEEDKGGKGVLNQTPSTTMKPRHGLALVVFVVTRCRLPSRPQRRCKTGETLNNACRPLSTRIHSCL
jgi:hypothetical protein